MMTRYVWLTLFVCLFLLAACTDVSPTVEPTEVVVVFEGEMGRETAVSPPTSTVIPSIAPAHIPIPTATDDDVEDFQEMRNEGVLSATTVTPIGLSTPTVEPTLTAESSSDSPAPTVALWTGIGTPMPMVQVVISPENASQIQELGRWGKGSIKNAHYSLDGSQLVVATAFGVYFYDAETAQLLQFFQAREELTAFSLSDDENLLAVGYKWPGSIDVFEVDTGNLLLTIDTEHSVGSLIFSSDQKSLIANIYYNGVKRWRIRDGVSLDTDPSDAALFSLARDGKTSVTKMDEQVQLWQLVDGEFREVPTNIVPDMYFDRVEISPDGQLLAIGADSELQVEVWRLSDQTRLYTLDTTPPEIAGVKRQALGKPVYRSGPGPNHIVDMEFSPDSKSLVVTNGYSELSIWSMENGELQKRIKDFGGRIDYSPDGKRLAVWSVNLSQIQVDDGAIINVLPHYIGSAKGLEFMPDGNNLAMGSYDGSIYIRRVSDGALYKRFYSNDGAITALDVSSDGAILVSGSADSMVRIWNVDDGSSVGTTGLSGFEIEHISISHDNQYAISSIWDGGLALWRMEDGSLMESGFGFAGVAIQPAVFSPTEMVFARMANENSLGLWSSFDVFKAPQQRLTGPTEFGAKSLAYSPDGNLLAAGGADSQVWIWRIADGALVLQLDEAFSENAGIEQVEFSPDGKLLAAISSWKIYLWDLSDGELLHMIDSQYGWLNDIAFSPNGRYLAVGSSEGVVRLWGIPSP